MDEDAPRAVACGRRGVVAGGCALSGSTENRGIGASALLADEEDSTGTLASTKLLATLRSTTDRLILRRCRKCTRKRMAVQSLKGGSAGQGANWPGLGTFEPVGGVDVAACGYIYRGQYVNQVGIYPT